MSHMQPQQEDWRDWKLGLWLKKVQKDVAVEYQTTEYRLKQMMIENEIGEQYMFRTIGPKDPQLYEKNKDFFEKLIKNDEKDSVLFPVVMNCLESIFDRKQCRYSFITERYHMDICKFIIQAKDKTKELRLHDVLLKTIQVLITILESTLKAGYKDICSFGLSSFKAIRVGGAEYVVKFDWLDPIMLLGRLTISEQIRKILYLICSIMVDNIQPSICNLKQILQSQAKHAAFLDSYRRQNKLPPKIKKKFDHLQSGELILLYSTMNDLVHRPQQLTCNHLKNLMPKDTVSSADMAMLMTPITTTSWFRSI